MKRAYLHAQKQGIKKDPNIQKWLMDLRPNTQKSYLNAITLFCIINKITPSEMLNTAWKEQEERLPPWQQSIEKWFDNLKKYFIDANYSKHTASTRKVGVTNFFHFNRIDTPRAYSRRKSELKVKNEREGLTKEDIKDALNAAITFKIKALILTQATSGLSISDVLKLDYKQFQEGVIQLNKGKEICKIYNKRTKTESEHYTFISHEAVELIKKYLELERNPPIQGPLFAAESNGNKRYTHPAYHTALQRLNKRLNWDNGSYVWNKLTSHMLRKFFESQLTDAGCIHEHITHFMGWKLPGMRAHYYLANPEELEKSYIKHLDYLSLENVETVTLESEEVRELKNSHDDLRKDFNEYIKGTVPYMKVIQKNQAIRKLVEDELNKS